MDLTTGDEEDAEDTEVESEYERPAPRRKLTEGKIDVDEDLESDSSGDDRGDDEDHDESKEDEALADKNALLEKAAAECRLPTKRLTPDEYALFPFLETAEPRMRDAFIVARNAAVSSTSLPILPCKR